MLPSEESACLNVLVRAVIGRLWQSAKDLVTIVKAAPVSTMNNPVLGLLFLDLTTASNVG